MDAPVTERIVGIDGVFTDEDTRRIAAALSEK
jgi:hypothetical protein